MKEAVSDNRKLADYAMVFELMGRLAGHNTEQKVAAGIVELFTTLCGPKSVEYMPVQGEMPVSEEQSRQMDFSFEGDYMLTEGGFVLRVGSTSTLAFVNVENVMFPEFLDHYVNLALSVRGVLEISINNARNYQKLLKAKARLRAEKDTTQAYALELERYRNHLEELVEERTDDLVTEIEARKKVEADLRRSEGEFRGIVDNAIAGIFKSSEGKILYANGALARMFGFDSPEEMLSQHVSCPCCDERYKPLFTEGLCSSNVLDGVEVEIRTKTEEKRKLLLSSRLQEKVLTTVAMDITGLKEAQDRLELALEEVARSNRDLQQFAYIASHDLSEPLRVIAGYLNILQRKYGDSLDKKGQGYLRFAIDGAAKMEMTITDLLEYSRVQTQARPFNPTDSGAVLRVVLGTLQAAIDESGASITYGAMPVVYADEPQLARVFQNLISNAIKFRGKEPPKVLVTAAETDKEWVFSVADNGIGIKPEHMDRVFEMFSRFHPEYKGSGIGLASCKRIVERHGGRIWVESEPGRGSVFRFTIPIKQRQHAIDAGKAA